MVKTKVVNLNGTDFIQTYSDEGKFIQRENQQYFEAIDPVGFVRDYTEVENSSTEELTPYEVNRQIAEQVENLGGITTKITQSDKLGYNWEETYVGETLVKQVYIEQEKPFPGSSDNPIKYEEGVKLIDNAYYLVDGVRKVYMAGEFIEM